MKEHPWSPITYDIEQNMVTTKVEHGMLSNLLETGNDIRLGGAPANKTAAAQNAPVNKTAAAQNAPVNKTAAAQNTPVNATTAAQNAPVNKTAAA